VGALGSLVLLVRRRRELAPGVLALAATLAAGQAAAAAVVFPAIDVLKTGRPFYARIAPLVAHGEPLAYFGNAFHSAPILELRRRVAYVRTEADLKRWLDETPGGLVLADESNWRRVTLPALRDLRVVDRQPVGGDAILLLAEAR
jgi:hypothetical protein